MCLLCVGINDSELMKWACWCTVVCLENSGVGMYFLRFWAIGSSKSKCIHRHLLIPQCSSLMDDGWEFFEILHLLHVEYYFRFSLDMWMLFFQIYHLTMHWEYFLKFFCKWSFLCVKLNNVRHSPSQVRFPNQERPKNGFHIIFAIIISTGIHWVIQLTF